MTSDRTCRIADAVAIVACTFFALVSLWEAAGPLQGGHLGSVAAVAISAENMLRWHKFAVVPGYVNTPPLPADYYCHHPYGPTMLGVIAYLIGGHHWLTVRLPAIVCSILSAPVVYALGRAMWGVLPAVLATVVFVCIPVDLAFNNFSNLEVPTIFFGLVFSWATVRLWQTWRKRWVLVAGLAALAASQADWVGLVLACVVVGFGFVRAYALPRRWYGRVNDRLFAQWFGYVTAASVGTFVMYVVLFAKADHLGDLLSSYHVRTGGAEVPWRDVFTQRRKMWISWMVTPIGLGTVAVGFPLSLLRLVRRPVEIIPIAWTLAATFQYFGFKEGADVHIFWPHYYGPAAALAAGVIAASLLWFRSWLLSVVPPRARSFVGRAVAAAIFVLLVVPTALVARTAVPQLVQARKTSGRFDDGGRHIDTDADAAQFAQWAAHDVPADGALVVRSGFPFGHHAEYGAQRPGRTRGGGITTTFAQDPERFGIADIRTLPTGELQTLAKQFAVQAAGPFWRFDRAAAGPAFTALRYVERQPNWWQWMFVSGTDLIRTIGPDVDQFATWEWGDALGFQPTAPSAAPGALEELRIAHNVAVEHGDKAKAAALRARVLAAFGHSAPHDYSDGVHLLGVDVDQGAATVVTLLWETDPAYLAADVSYAVKCKIVAPPRLWKSATDYFEKDMAPAPTLRPALWKPSYMYTQRFIALNRIGTEECRGAFTAASPRLLDGAADVLLFTVK